MTDNGKINIPMFQVVKSNPNPKYTWYRLIILLMLSKQITAGTGETILFPLISAMDLLDTV